MNYPYKKLTLEDVARIAHEHVRVLRVCVGDRPLMAWEDAPEEMREDCIEGVRFVYENPGLSPEAHHNKWFTRKVEDGWTCDHIYDWDARTHPELRRWEKAGELVRIKSRLMIQTVDLLRPIISIEDEPGGSDLAGCERSGDVSYVRFSRGYVSIQQMTVYG